MNQKESSNLFSWRQTMEKNQKIHCTVESCTYHNKDKNLCVLEAIQVTPIANKKTMKPDESMCASYEYEKE